MGAVLSRFFPVETLKRVVLYLRDAVARQFKNDFLAGGLAMAVAGVLSSACWQLLWWLRATIRATLFTTVEIPVHSTSFAPLMRWLETQPSAWDTSMLYVMRQRGNSSMVPVRYHCAVASGHRAQLCVVLSLLHNACGGAVSDYAS